MLKSIKYQSYDENFIKNKEMTYSSLLKTRKNDVTDINVEFGGRQKQSISRDVFVKIPRSGNNNGVASSVPAISNEHYQKPTSLLSTHANAEIIRPKTLSKSRITTKCGHITLFNDQAKKHDKIYYILKACDDCGTQDSAQPNLHTNNTDISIKQKCNGFQDENILYKKQIKMISSKHENLTQTNSNMQDNNNLPFSKTLNEQELKSKTKNSLTKVKILNQVLQNPWRPILPYNFRPVSRRDYEVVKSKLDNIHQLDDCYDNPLEAASVINLSEKIFSNNDAIGTKIRQHSSYYTCVECDKSFSQLRNFKYHMSVHRGTKEFATTCPVCGKYFNDRGYLSSHMKIHRNRMEYKCTLCPKSFNQRVAYNMHVRIHTGIKPHVCDDCGKAFSRKMLLKQHQRTHSGERPYACSYCDKRFADRSNMTLHLRLHTGVKPFICNLCPKTFTKKHHLKSHLNFHTGDKPYSCPRCKLAFTQSSNMRTHYKKCNAQPTDEEK